MFCVSSPFNIGHVFYCRLNALASLGVLQMSIAIRFPMRCCSQSIFRRRRGDLAAIYDIRFIHLVSIYSNPFSPSSSSVKCRSYEEIFALTLGGRKSFFGLTNNSKLWHPNYYALRLYPSRVIIRK